MTLLWVPYAIQGREGWMFGGNARFVPAPKPRKFWDTAIYVCAQTEGGKGGHFNSINMYDMAVISVRHSQLGRSNSRFSNAQIFKSAL